MIIPDSIRNRPNSMRPDLRTRFLQQFMDAKVLVQITLIDGTIFHGHIREFDADSLLIESKDNVLLISAYCMQAISESADAYTTDWREEERNSVSFAEKLGLYRHCPYES